MYTGRASQTCHAAIREVAMGSHRYRQLCGLIALTALAVGVQPAAAQQQFEAPAHVAFIDGVAAHEREGTSRAPTPGVPFLPGDRLRSAEGRIEVLLADGTAIHLDEFTEIDLLAPTLLRLTSGRVLIIIAGAENPADAPTIQVDTSAGSAAADGPGEYRVAVRPSAVGSEVEFSVYRGYGLLVTETGSLELSAGERSVGREGARPQTPSAFNVARFDAFDRWSQVRRDARMVDAVSGEFLPGTLRSYGAVFDKYGDWDYEPDYGRVWYPAVAPDWRPYYNGYWTTYQPYGWTWIAHDPWGWPTHHYGRWGYARARWFWIPDHHWGPGWVSWAYAPGYTAWCPLGYANVPVFSLSIGFGGTWGGGWVVTSGSYFSGGYGYAPVHQYAVPHNRLPPPRDFAPRPDPPPVATPPGGGPRPVPRAGGVQAGLNGNQSGPRAGASGASAPRAGGTSSSLSLGSRAGSFASRAGGSTTAASAPRAGVTGRTSPSQNHAQPARDTARASSPASSSTASRAPAREGIHAVRAPVTQGRAAAEAAPSQTTNSSATNQQAPARRVFSSGAPSNTRADTSTVAQTAPPAAAQTAPPQGSRPRAMTHSGLSPTSRIQAPPQRQSPPPEAAQTAPPQGSQPRATTHSGLSPTSRVQSPPQRQSPPPAAAPAPSVRAFTPSAQPRSSGASSAPSSSGGSAPRAAAAPRAGAPSHSGGSARTSSAPSLGSSSGTSSSSGSSGSSGGSSGGGRTAHRR